MMSPGVEPRETIEGQKKSGPEVREHPEANDHPSSPEGRTDMLEAPIPASDTWAHDHIAESQTCPVCFAPVANNATRENRGIMLADYVCGGVKPHLWSVRWGLAQVSA